MIFIYIDQLLPQNTQNTYLYSNSKNAWKMCFFEDRRGVNRILFYGYPDDRDLRLKWQSSKYHGCSSGSTTCIYILHTKVFPLQKHDIHVFVQKSIIIINMPIMMGHQIDKPRRVALNNVQNKATTSKNDCDKNNIYL